MKTIQVLLGERLLRAADREARREKVSRSELVRVALRAYLRRREELHALDEHDRRGYERFPVCPGEVDVWDRATAWPEDGLRRDVRIVPLCRAGHRPVSRPATRATKVGQGPSSPPETPRTW